MPRWSEREMREDIERRLAWCAKHGIHITAPIEHSIVPALLHHEYWLTIPPRRPALNMFWGVARGTTMTATAGCPPEHGYGGGTEFPRLVLEHPEACGCDALPDHVLMEG